MACKAAERYRMSGDERRALERLRRKDAFGLLDYMAADSPLSDGEVEDVLDAYEGILGSGAWCDMLVEAMHEAHYSALGRPM